MSETGRPQRVLVVDDEEYIRLLVGQILAHAGYEVDFASDGASGLSKIEAARPDLVILDLMMPGIDGWGVLERLRGRADRPPIVVLTAHGGYEIFTRLVREGVTAYMSKPFSLRELIATCEKALAQPAKAEVTERRRDPRRTLLVAVEVFARQAASPVLGELVNLSVEGAQVDLGVPLETGERLEIVFRVPGGGTPMRLEGRVEWRAQARGGFAHGLAFRNIAAGSRRELHELLGGPGGVVG